MAPGNLIQAQYDQMASTYDRRWQGYLDQSLRLIQAWLEILATDRVLDLGCGTGELAARLLNDMPNLEFTGVDLSAQMLTVAQAKCQIYPQAKFQQASAAQLPFPDASFDWIVSSSVFHYFPNPKDVLAEIRRVLKPQGQVVILDWCKDYLVCQLYDWVLPWLDPAYVGCYSAREFKEVLHTSGLEIQQFERVRTSWAWEFMIAKITHRYEAV